MFFKRVFSQYRDRILALLSDFLPVDCGKKVLNEPSVEIIKGALRIDKIYETDNKRIVIIDFEDPFTLDSYFEILMHTAAHIHSTAYYKRIVKSGRVQTKYIPIIVSINATKKHLQFMKKNNIAFRIKDGIYVAKSSPFFEIYIIIFREMNITEHFLRVANLCRRKEECHNLAEKIRNPELWEEAIKKGDAQIKRILYKLVSVYGEMLYLTNPKVDYLLNIWRFANNIESEEVAKIY